MEEVHHASWWASNWQWVVGSAVIPIILASVSWLVMHRERLPSIHRQRIKSLPHVALLKPYWEMGEKSGRAIEIYLEVECTLVGAARIELEGELSRHGKWFLFLSRKVERLRVTGAKDVPSNVGWSGTVILYIEGAVSEFMKPGNEGQWKLNSTIRPTNGKRKKLCKSGIGSIQIQNRPSSVLLIK